MVPAPPRRHEPISCCGQGSLGSLPAPSGRETSWERVGRVLGRTPHASAGSAVSVSIFTALATGLLNTQQSHVLTG